MTKQRKRPVKPPQGLSIPAMKKLIRRKRQEKQSGKRTKGR